MPALDLSLVLHQALYVAMIAGIVLIVAVPFFPGLALILLSLLLYVGYASYTAHTLAGMDMASLAMVVVLSVVGLTSASWSERLGIRFAYMDQQVLAYATIFSFVGIYLWGIPGLLIGLVLGALVGELQARRPFPEALRRAFASMMSALGPRGFQLLMAIVVCSIVEQHLAMIASFMP